MWVQGLQRYLLVLSLLCKLLGFPLALMACYLGFVEELVLSGYCVGNESAPLVVCVWVGVGDADSSCSVFGCSSLQALGLLLSCPSRGHTCWHFPVKSSSFSFHQEELVLLLATVEWPCLPLLPSLLWGNPAALTLQCDLCSAS